jgi:hypothetical protein
MTESRRSRGPRIRAIGAGVVAGLAFWCTRGGLEVVAGTAGPLRVAVMPSPWQGLSIVAAMAGAALALAHLTAWAATGQGRTLTDADADVTRPLAATGVLVLPFLPFVADAWPALTVLASRFSLLVWLVAVLVTLRAAIIRARDARGLVVAVYPGRTWVPVFLAGVAIYGLLAWRFAGGGLFPGGDEPHYLVIAQSLWRDHDLKIENNHVRGDTQEYYRQPLKPHYLVKGKDRQIYSIHPVGLPIVAAPIYAAGGYPAVVAFIVLCAAAAASCLWLAAARLTGSGPAATIGWLGAATTAPFVFNSITVYPEIPAAACAMAAWLLATRSGGLTSRRGLAVACGILLAALPWLSSKYALMMAAIGLVALGRIWWPVDPVPGVLEPKPETPPTATPRQRIAASIALGLPMVVSVGVWMAFFQWIWGSPFPSVVYGSQRMVGPEYLVRGAPGLLFDQEYGIVAAAPIFAAALAGLAVMLAAGGPARRVAIEVAGSFVALLVPVAAFHIWWGGSGAIGRPVIAGILLLGLPLAWLARRIADHAVAPAALIVLLAASWAQALFLAFAQQGLLLVAGRDGVSRLLSYWSPSWRLWSLAPSFLMQPPPIAWAFTAIWLVAMAAAAVVIWRLRRPLPPGAAGLAACTIAGGALAAVSLAVPATLDRHRAPTPPPGARPQSALLSGFDAQRRPLGVIFDPWRPVPAASIPPLVAFVAGPSMRGERTGIDLLYDARWSLPAGRYEIDLDARPRGRTLQGELGLQVGRVGPPLHTWTLPAADRWTTTVDLPANARFVGFRASADLTEVAPDLRLVPLAVPDLRTRRTDPDVVQSRLYGDAPVFFFDERVAPEPTGFWTRGDSASRLAVGLAPDRPTALRLRAGPSPATVTTIVDGYVEQVALAPRATRDVTLRSRHTVASVELVTAGGFVPAQIDPAAQDRRHLGVWVEVVR